MKSIIKLVALLFCFYNYVNAQVSFISNGQQINQAPGRNIVLGDFNNDGALDAFIVNSSDYRVYFNDGNGQFTDSGQRLTSPSGWTTPAVGDINGDGNLEVITGKTIWLNDGLGHFTAQSGMIETSEDGELSVKLADLNGDGRLDIFAIRNYAAMRVYLNDSTGQFTDSDQRLGDGAIGTGQLGHIALGDIDGNGTVDAVTTGWRWPPGSNGPCPNRVWLNDGLGNFHDSGQLLDEGDSHVHGLALGDLNNDGKPDLVMGIQDTYRSGRIYINDGSGRFTGGQNIGGASGENVALGDFDGNGTLDIFIALSAPPSRVWLNDGTGTLLDSGQRLGPNNVWNWDVAAGDLNSDDKIDAFVVASQLANVSQGSPAQIWLNTTVFTIDYFGQTPPGNTPVQFASGIVTGFVHGTIALSHKGDEIYWVVNPSTERIMHSKFEHGIWTTPALADFVKDYLTVHNGGPVFSPDGNKIFFYSYRTGGLGNSDVWYVERTGSKWSDPINVGEPYNTTDIDPTPIFTNKEKAYRFDYKTEKLCYTYSNNVFSNPESVTVHPDYSPWWSIYISPEEDYLIFAGGSENADLFIRFKDGEDQWCEPIDMGDKINTTDNWERFPVVSPDGKYLFFTRGGSSVNNLFWVSTAVIDSLKKTVTGVRKEKGAGIIENFRLNQNYPNPFNPSTVIGYQLSESSNVKIKIYDTLGQEIKTLVDSFQNVGNHSVVWNGTDNSNNPVSSGIYFYSLATNEKNLLRKMLLLR